MKLKQTSALLLASSFVLLTGCGATIDGETERSFKTSLAEMTKDMDSNEADNLYEASEFIAQYTSKKDRRDDLNGKKADAIIDLADVHAEDFIEKELAKAQQVIDDVGAFPFNIADVSFFVVPSVENGEGCFDISVKNKTPYKLGAISFSGRVNGVNSDGQETGFNFKTTLMSDFSSPFESQTENVAASYSHCAFGIAGLDDEMGQHGYFLPDEPVLENVEYKVTLKIKNITSVDSSKIGYKDISVGWLHQQAVADAQYQYDVIKSQQGKGLFGEPDDSISKPIIPEPEATKDILVDVDPDYTVPSKGELNENWGLFNTAQWQCKITGNKTEGCNRVAETASYHINIDAAVSEILGSYEGYKKCSGYRKCDYTGRYDWNDDNAVAGTNHFSKGVIGLPGKAFDGGHDYGLIYGLKSIGDRRVIQARLLNTGNPHIAAVDILDSKADLSDVNAQAALLIKFNK